LCELWRAYFVLQVLERSEIYARHDAGIIPFR
jgi:hypothetical protein